MAVFLDDDDDDEKNSIVSSTPSYRARIQDWERRREEAERQSNASTSVSSVSLANDDDDHARMRASSRNSGRGSLSSSLVPRERYNKVEPNRMNRFFLDDPVPHTRRGYGGNRYKKNLEPRRDKARRNTDGRRKSMDNGAYDEGTEEPEHRRHDKSGKKISDSRHSLEDKRYEDNNKKIARHSKPKVQEASDHSGRRRRNMEKHEKASIKDGATKTSNRNRKYEEEREHESRQDKDIQNRRRRSGGAAPIKASDQSKAFIFTRVNW